MTLRSDVAKNKKVIDLYKQYADGVFSKDSLEDELEKIRSINDAFGVKLKRVKITKKVKKLVPESPQGNFSIKELQARYNKGGLSSTDVEVEHHVEVLEDEPMSEAELQHKRSVLFSAKELEQYATQFKGFIQNCFNQRIKALQMAETVEEENPFNRAIANNVKLQVSKVLDEQV